MGRGKGFGGLADAVHFPGIEALFPGIELLAGIFFGLAEELLGGPCPGEPEALEDFLKTVHGSRTKVFMAQEEALLMGCRERKGLAGEALPKKAGLVDEVGRALGSRLDLRAEGGEGAFQQGGLGRPLAKVKGPALSLQGSDKGKGVAEEEDGAAMKVGFQPVHGKEREGVLEEEAVPPGRRPAKGEGVQEAPAEQTVGSKESEVEGGEAAGKQAPEGGKAAGVVA